KNISSLLPIPTLYRSDDLFDLPQADYRILTIGLFTENYGFADIVKAIELVYQRINYTIQLVILDGAVKKDDDYYKSIMHDQPWLYTFEAIPQSQVMSIMQQSNLFIRATREESYGLSKVE